MKFRAQRRLGGFSLIELLAAAAILGVLATVAVPVLETTMRRQKEQALRTALRDIRHGIDAYKLAADAGRIKTTSADSGYPKTLTDLTAGITDEKNQSGPKLYFLRRIPRDPFADPALSAIDSWKKRKFDSPPEAPVEGNDVFDVYSRSPLKGLNGVPYAEW
ncbi:type IV pilin protein [Massilia sp. SM-13]|uniref:type IV pilin protein n=1 Tax=Pseudoduganella rhizocola TaxID=3382643 RepID=UPI0038B4D1A1